MGHNLVWVCHRHRKFHTSMRGEEGVDFQALIRIDDCPGLCLRNHGLAVHGDQHASAHIQDYEEVFPDWDERPAVQLKKLREKEADNTDG